MRLEDNPDKGRKVWLSKNEIGQLMNAVEDTQKRIAFRLMAEAGLRTKEALRAKPADVKPLDDEDSDGYKLRVWEGKGDKYRETWLPSALAESIRIYADMDDLDSDERLINVTRQTIQRWVRAARETLAEETGDEGWQYLSAHDLRRTWGTQAIEAGVLPTVVMQAGGWDDFKTFQKHYMGQHGDNVVAREAAKVLG
jgi:integrase